MGGMCLRIANYKRNEEKRKAFISNMEERKKERIFECVTK